MPKNEVITGAIGIIKVKGRVIGKMRSLSATENMRRVPIRGIGTILPKEMPIVEWSGSLRCDFFNIDFNKSQIPGAIKRILQTVQQFEDNAILDDEYLLNVDIYKKVKDIIDDNGNIIPKAQAYATIRGLVINNESFDLTDGQVSSRNQSFDYIYPIIFPE